MSIDQIDEYEQGERVRSWLKNNGSSLLTGVALGLAAIGGWNWWQGRESGHRVEAAGQYAVLSEAVEAKDGDKISALVTALQKDYADTPYATLAVLRQASWLQSSGKTDEALGALDSLSKDATDPALYELAQLRAARLLLGLERHDEVIKRLDSLGAALFAATADELRGDAETARGNRDAARAAYADALAKLDVAAPMRPLLELKLTDAGGELPDQPEI